MLSIPSPPTRSRRRRRRQESTPAITLAVIPPILSLFLFSFPLLLHLNAIAAAQELTDVPSAPTTIACDPRLEATGVCISLLVGEAVNIGVDSSAAHFSEFHFVHSPTDDSSPKITNLHINIVSPHAQAQAQSQARASYTHIAFPVLPAVQSITLHVASNASVDRITFGSPAIPSVIESSLAVQNDGLVATLAVYATRIGSIAQTSRDTFAIRIGGSGTFSSILFNKGMQPPVPFYPTLAKYNGALFPCLEAPPLSIYGGVLLHVPQETTWGSVEFHQLQVMMSHSFNAHTRHPLSNSTGLPSSFQLMHAFPMGTNVLILDPSATLQALSLHGLPANRLVMPPFVFGSFIKNNTLSPSSSPGTLLGTYNVSGLAAWAYANASSFAEFYHLDLPLRSNNEHLSTTSAHTLSPTQTTMAGSTLSPAASFHPQFPTINSIIFNNVMLATPTENNGSTCSLVRRLMPEDPRTYLPSPTASPQCLQEASACALSKWSQNCSNPASSTAFLTGVDTSNSPDASSNPRLVVNLHINEDRQSLSSTEGFSIELSSQQLFGPSPGDNSTSAGTPDSLPRWMTFDLLFRHKLIARSDPTPVYSTCDIAFPALVFSGHATQLPQSPLTPYEWVVEWEASTTCHGNQARNTSAPSIPGTTTTTFHLPDFHGHFTTLSSVPPFTQPTTAPHTRKSKGQRLTIVVIVCTVLALLAVALAVIEIRRRRQQRLNRTRHISTARHESDTAALMENDPLDPAFELEADAVDEAFLRYARQRHHDPLLHTRWPATAPSHALDSANGAMVTPSDDADVLHPVNTSMRGARSIRNVFFFQVASAVIQDDVQALSLLLEHIDFAKARGGTPTLLPPLSLSWDATTSSSLSTSSLIHESTAHAVREMPSLLHVLALHQFSTAEEEASFAVSRRAGTAAQQGVRDNVTVTAQGSTPRESPTFLLCIRLIAEGKMHFSARELNRANSDGMTPLMLCAMTNNVSLARILLETQADITCTSNMGYSALIIAVLYGSREVVSLLVHAPQMTHAAFWHKDFSGKSAMDWALDINDDVIPSLVEVDDLLFFEEQHFLIAAAGTGNVDAVRRICESVSDVSLGCLISLQGKFLSQSPALLNAIEEAQVGGDEELAGRFVEVQQILKSHEQRLQKQGKTNDPNLHKQRFYARFQTVRKKHQSAKVKAKLGALMEKRHALVIAQEELQKDIAVLMQSIAGQQDNDFAVNETNIDVSSTNPGTTVQAPTTDLAQPLHSSSLHDPLSATKVRSLAPLPLQDDMHTATANRQRTRRQQSWQQHAPYSVHSSPFSRQSKRAGAMIMMHSLQTPTPNAMAVDDAAFSQRSDFVADPQPFADFSASSGARLHRKAAERGEASDAPGHRRNWAQDDDHLQLSITHQMLSSMPEISSPTTVPLQPLNHSHSSEEAPALFASWQQLHHHASQSHGQQLSPTHVAAKAAPRSASYSPSTTTLSATNPFFGYAEHQ